MTTAPPLARFAERTTDLLFAADAEGLLTYVNAAGRRLFGEAARPGQPVVHLAAPADRGRLAMALARLRQGIDEHTALELAARGADGRPLWLDLRLHADTDGAADLPEGGALRGGPPYGVQGIAREVTERREAEQLAARQTDRLRLLYTVTSTLAGPLDDHLEQALGLTATLLDLEIGVLSHIEGDTYTVVAAVSPRADIEAGATFPLGETYCALALEHDDVVDVAHAACSPVHRYPCYAAFRLEAYIGTPVRVDGRVYGTLGFSSPRPRAPFTEADRDLLRLLALWVGSALERRARERALRESEARFRTLAEATFEGVLLSRDGVITDANAQAARLLGAADPGALVGRAAADFMAPEDRPRVGRILAENRAETYEARVVRADGRAVDVEVRGRPADGGASRVTALRDVTSQKAAERQLRFQADVLAHVSEAVVVVDSELRITYWNGGAERLHGRPAAEVLGRRLDEVARYAWPDPDAPATAARLLRAGAHWTGSLRYEHPDGSHRYVSIACDALRDEAGRVTGTLAIVRDVTREQAMQARLHHQATHDPLTGLPNRARFHEHLQEALESRGAAVLFVDLDRFKHVNDSLGHRAGDAVLRAVAERLREAVGARGLVGRLGGDEFGAVLGAGHEGDAPALAEALLAALRAPLRVEGHDVRVEASIGVAVVPPSSGAAPRAADLLRDADTAMYAAKRAGRHRVVAFEPRMREEAERRSTLSADLRGALERGELRVAYQPIVDLRTGAVVGAEALARWAHPERGLLLPGAFVPLAEELGLVAELDRGVFAAACAEAATWPGDGPRLHVNCADQTCLDASFAPFVADALTRSGLAPGRVVVELTERALLADTDVAAARLGSLRALGVRVGLDDFGTGYAALGLLPPLPIDALKIDRSFVGDLEGRSGPIVASVLDLAGSLGLEVVAEGVETEAQRVRLSAAGCTYGQGFLFAPPLEADALRPLLHPGSPPLGRLPG